MTRSFTYTKTYNSRERVLKDISNERNHQDEKWGQSDHICSMWMTILQTWVGKLSDEMLDELDSHAYYSPMMLAQKWQDENVVGPDRGQLYRRSIQIAAIATAFAEQLFVAGLREEEILAQDR